VSPVNDPGIRRASLRLLATTDVHVHLLAHDYYADRAAAVGLAKTATLIAAARAEACNTVLLDNGDFLQGNPLGDYVIAELSGDGASTSTHPAIRVMNALRYDAACLGNHEFNYGLDLLERALRGASFPVVCANIARSLGDGPLKDALLNPPYALLHRQIRSDDGQALPLCVGVIGFAPPQITQWDELVLGGAVVARGIVEAAAAWVPKLRAEGADIVVALSHSGIGTPDEVAMAENATGALALIPGIDAIIAGHSHLVFPSGSFADLPGVCLADGTVHGVPAVMPGFNGSHLGVIDLRLQHQGGRWRVEGSQVEARPITADTDDDPGIAAAAHPEHECAVAHARRAIGFSPIAINSFFACIGVSAALDVVARAQIAHVAASIAGRPEASLPVLAAVAPFKAGGRGGPVNYTDIPAGEIALRHASDLYIFPNTIAALRLTGAALREWLEISAGIYRQILPSSCDAPLIDPDFPSYNHDQIFGLSAMIDLSQPARYDRHGCLRNPAAHRVQSLTYAGQSVDPEQEFILATNSYRAAGSGGYIQADPSRHLDLDRTPIRDLLIRHLASVANPARPEAPRFGFCPMPGTTVTFATSPAAAAHLDDIADLRPEPLGSGPDGFARFRLHL
jgi:2',3'-cyclic-nucleotide 2'-phosphodiesterase/3'-nucleotidase